MELVSLGTRHAITSVNAAYDYINLSDNHSVLLAHVNLSINLRRPIIM